ncbi:MAG: acyl-CoA thioesterase [Planctomycetaceae bacterium]|jgi:acyl-CoA thioester hydrolase|nr:acyl-CoA thioesterase [Planctomycetaceae bacterium]
MSIYQYDHQIRVRYQETDQMGVVYHANYFTYFEIARTETLRSLGKTYRDLEASGCFLVVNKAECSFKKPAKYDDLITVRTIVERITHVKIEHKYEVYRGEELLAVGKTVLAAVDCNGQIIRLPQWLAPQDAQN